MGSTSRPLTNTARRRFSKSLPVLVNIGRVVCVPVKDPRAAGLAVLHVDQRVEARATALQARPPPDNVLGKQAQLRGKRRVLVVVDDHGLRELPPERVELEVGHAQVPALQERLLRPPRRQQAPFPRDPEEGLDKVALRVGAPAVDGARPRLALEEERVVEAEAVRVDEEAERVLPGTVVDPRPFEQGREGPLDGLEEALARREGGERRPEERIEGDARVVGEGEAVVDVRV